MTIYKDYYEAHDMEWEALRAEQEAVNEECFQQALEHAETWALDILADEMWADYRAERLAEIGVL